MKSSGFRAHPFQFAAATSRLALVSALVLATGCASKAPRASSPYDEEEVVPTPPNSATQGCETTDLGARVSLSEGAAGQPAELAAGPQPVTGLACTSRQNPTGMAGWD